MAVTLYSTEITANLAPLYAPLKTNQSYGRVRCSSFKFTAAATASGTTIAVAIIPKSARIISGSIIASATLANTAQVSVGIAGKDATGYYDDAVASGPGFKTDNTAVTTGTPVADTVAGLKAAAVLGATAVPFVLTQALGYNYETAKEVYLTLTTSVGALTTEVITGHVFYVVD